MKSNKEDNRLKVLYEWHKRFYRTKILRYTFLYSLNDMLLDIYLNEHYDTFALNLDDIDNIFKSILKKKATKYYIDNNYSIGIMEIDDYGNLYIKNYNNRCLLFVAHKYIPILIDIIKDIYKLREKDVL